MDSAIVPWFRRKGWKKLAAETLTLAAAHIALYFVFRSQAETPTLAFWSSVLATPFYYLALLSLCLSNMSLAFIKEVSGLKPAQGVTNPFQDTRVVAAYSTSHPNSVAMYVYRMKYLALIFMLFAGIRLWSTWPVPNWAWNRAVLSSLHVVLVRCSPQLCHFGKLRS